MHLFSELWTILCTINVYEQQIRCRYDFYEILQVDRQDPEEKIEQAFKELEYSQSSKYTYNLIKKKMSKINLISAIYQKAGIIAMPKFTRRHGFC